MWVEYFHVSWGYVVGARCSSLSSGAMIEQAAVTECGAMNAMRH
ncbi:MAG: hypothetical protein AB7V04_03435 [Desulfomonilaceae bacterium]